MTTREALEVIALYLLLALMIAVIVSSVAAYGYMGYMFWHGEIGKGIALFLLGTTLARIAVVVGAYGTKWSRGY